MNDLRADGENNGVSQDSDFHMTVEFRSLHALAGFVALFNSTTPVNLDSLPALTQQLVAGRSPLKDAIDHAPGHPVVVASEAAHVGGDGGMSVG